MSAVKVNEQVAREVAELRDLSRDQLVEQWVSLFGQEPPKRLTQDLLVRSIAYDRQARSFGGLSKKEKKGLVAIAIGRASHGSGTAENGTRLYRTWQGTTHEVLVSESGYLWKGQTYDSLSSVARAITGTRWSGPRFFGVRS